MVPPYHKSKEPSPFVKGLKSHGFISMRALITETPRPKFTHCTDIKRDNSKLIRCFDHS